MLSRDPAVIVRGCAPGCSIGAPGASLAVALSPALGGTGRRRGAASSRIDGGSAISTVIPVLAA